MKKRRTKWDEWDGSGAEIWHDKLNETGNPYYAWEAIRACTEDRYFHRLPDWLMAYLGECAERMLSSKAKAAGDLGRVLPWVLGFPARRGPWRDLDQEEDDRRFEFALVFAALLQQGEDVPVARQDAYNLVFDGADVDDRTLQRWLLKEFGLKRQPPTIEEWKRVTEARFCDWPWPLDQILEAIKADKVSRDPVVT